MSLTNLVKTVELALNKASYVTIVKLGEKKGPGDSKRLVPVTFLQTLRFWGVFSLSVVQLGFFIEANMA